MTTEIPYNVHFEASPTGHLVVAPACGDGWWEEWVYITDREWRRLAELLLDGRASATRALSRRGIVRPQPRDHGREPRGSRNGRPVRHVPL